MKFKCKNGICIDSYKKCDGIPDCGDESDEIGCSSTIKPSLCAGKYDCLDNKTCIENTKVCDSISDCPNGIDEKGCFVDNCAERELNKCTQLCVNLRQGYKCSCYKGYVLGSDQSSCLDMDECSSILLNNCTQKCINTEGSYKCDCEYGFQWDVARKSCKVAGNFEKAKLIFSSKSQIRVLTLSTKFYDLWQQNGRHFFGIDYIYSTGAYFWIDTNPGQIMKSNISNPRLHNVFASSALPSPHSLAVDWVGKNLYVTDLVLHSLVVFDIEVGYFKTLFVDQIDQPRALALSPQNGFVFYTVIERYASIGRITMDGKTRLKIIKDNIVSPKGITVDFFSKRLYWTDSHLHRIEMASFDGSHRRVLIQRLSFPYSIAVFGDDIFWSDLKLATINKAHKISGSSKMVLKRDVEGVYSLKVGLFCILLLTLV